MKNKFAIFLLGLASTQANAANAKVTVISSPDLPHPFSQQEVRNLYLGTTQFERIELIDQAASPAKVEFYEHFLGKTELQMKQQWSVLVFSGHRAPQVLADNLAVLDYVLQHKHALGYVGSDFLTDWLAKHGNVEKRPQALFVIPATP